MAKKSPPIAHAGIERRPFGVTSDGIAVERYILTNSNGAILSLMNYGAAVTHLIVPDKNGVMADVTLGFDTFEQYQRENPYFGAVIGRVANRIANGTFSIDKVRYCLPVNNGLHHLHGGMRGYDKRVWAADAMMSGDGPAVRFTLTDPDGSEGYPGTLQVTVIYSLTGQNGLKIQYFATTDKSTPINLTNHTYFNLKDAGKSSIANHVMKAYATHYTPGDAALIPTGQIAPVKGTPIDFTHPKPIGRDLAAMGGDPAGYDHNLVLTSQDGALAKAAEVYEPDSGRLMEVWTTQPGVQFYTGNFLSGSVKGKDAIAYQQHSAFCLETQHYPDSVNHPNFPSTILRPGEIYRQITEYRFKTSAQSPW